LRTQVDHALKLFPCKQVGYAAAVDKIHLGEVEARVPL
jgi:hypothetical protein